MKDNKIIIGITGKGGSGKDTVADHIQSKYKAKKLIFSNLLQDALEVFIDDIGREDYSWLSTNLRKRFGEGILAKGMKKMINRTRTEIVVLSGVRDRGELKMIRSYNNGYLICVEAGAKTRWSRLMTRKNKADDNVPYRVFREKKEKLPSEEKIKELSKRADYRIKNEGDLRNLAKNIEEVMRDILSKSK